MITFEDLIVLLFDLTQSFKNDPNLMEQSVPSTTKAQFTFNLMLPDKQVTIPTLLFTYKTITISFSKNNSRAAWIRPRFFVMRNAYLT